MSTHYQRFRNELAGAYVLGTLLPQVRRRFEALLKTDAELAANLVFWEGHFGHLALDQVVPVAPPAHLHGVIRKRLAPVEKAPLKVVEKAAQPAKKQARFGWLLPSAAAMAAGFFLAVLLRPAPAPLAPFVVVPPKPTVIEPPKLAAVLPAQLALISSESGDQLWLIGVEAEGLRMEVRNLNALSAPANKDYELWALAKKEGAPPVSLGLLPGDAVIERELSTAQQAALANANAVAISEEPTGGSTTGTPTGPVVYSAPLVSGQQQQSST